MTEFNREEDRYIVLKHSDLDKIPNKKAVRAFYDELSLIGNHSCRISQRKFLVIESDWPEFEPAYKMIEARVACQPTEVEQLRALSVSNIMLEVVPGEDGMGEEVYAKSVADIETLFKPVAFNDSLYDCHIQYFSPNGKSLKSLYYKNGVKAFPSKYWLDSDIILTGTYYDSNHTTVLWQWFDKKNNLIRQKKDTGNSDGFSTLYQ